MSTGGWITQSQRDGSVTSHFSQDFFSVGFSRFHQAIDATHSLEPGSSIEWKSKVTAQ
jgi:hypothetical protein